MNSTTISTEETIDQHVGRLLRTWRADTAYLSSSTRITEHPAYLELIALGDVALPSLFRDIEQTKDGHLAKALTAITGIRPIPQDERGYVRTVAETWLHWAKENHVKW